MITRSALAVMPGQHHQHKACHEPISRHAVVLGDEASTATLVRDRLGHDGYRVRHYPQPHQFFRDLHALSPCLVVACTPFADIGHDTVVRRIRDLYGLSAPVVVVGADEDTTQQLATLEAGADDCLGRGLPMDLLMGRIRALMRRLPQGRPDDRRVRLDAYLIDYGAQYVSVADRPVALTPKEFDLFWVFASSFGRLISKRELLTCVWGQNCELDTHTLSQHVHALRRKLRLSEHGLQLTALYGAGYRLERLGGAASMIGPERPLADVATHPVAARGTDATQEPDHAWQ